MMVLPSLHSPFCTINELEVRHVTKKQGARAKVMGLGHF
jgi:hypothetical protein